MQSVLYFVCLQDYEKSFLMLYISQMSSSKIFILFCLVSYRKIVEDSSFDTMIEYCCCHVMLALYIKTVWEWQRGGEALIMFYLSRTFYKLQIKWLAVMKDEVHLLKQYWNVSKVSNMWNNSDFQLFCRDYEDFLSNILTHCTLI